MPREDEDRIVPLELQPVVARPQGGGLDRAAWSAWAQVVYGAVSTDAWVSFVTPP